MIKSLIMAFSTYSRVPMPRVKWDEKYMKYIMCFFPFVGLFIGGCQFAITYGVAHCECIKITAVLLAAIMTVVPIIVTGGIHMDGFMDTVDAKNSYKPMEEKLKILKDPHTGAFAIIYGIVYMLLYFAFSYQLASYQWCTGRMVLFALGYVLSRVLSGLSVVTLKKAKKDGMLAGTNDMADKKTKYIMLAELVALAVSMIIISPVLGAGLVGIAFLCFLYYSVMSKKIFGGVTGDLAGYFLQICELMILVGVCVIPL